MLDFHWVAQHNKRRRRRARRRGRRYKQTKKPVASSRHYPWAGCCRPVRVTGVRHGDGVCVCVLLSEASCDACECSVNRAIDCASARTSVAECCNERSTAVSWTRAPAWRCALSALKQDPAAQLDKRCARPCIQMGDVKLNAASAPIHSCWHPRRAGSVFSTFGIKLVSAFGRRAPLLFLRLVVRHRCTWYKEVSLAGETAADGGQIGFLGRIDLSFLID